MNAILIQLGKNLGLNYSNDYLTLTGKYRNFKLYIYQLSNTNTFTIKFPFTVQISTADSMKLNLINTLKSKYINITKCNFEESTLTLNLNSSHDEAYDISILTDIINNIVDFAESNTLTSCCEICKLDLPTDLHDFDNTLYLICDNCNTNLQSSTLKNSKKDISDSNIITGIIGALLGSLVGVALWVFIFQLGYIASLCGMLITVCAMKGYELFGGKLNASGIIITIIITIAMVYLSNYLSYSLYIYTTFKDTEYITIFDAIKSVGNFIREFSDFKKEFIKDLLMGYVFTLIGTFSIFKNALK